MEIRPLTAADAAEFWALRLRGLREHPEAFLTNYEDVKDEPVENSIPWLVRPDGWVLGAFDPRLVGVVGCIRERPTKIAHKARVWGMHVAAEAQGRGVGRALVEALIARARVWGDVTQLELGVMVGNAPARALYRSFGFVTYGVEPNAMKIGGRLLDEELMVLRL